MNGETEGTDENVVKEENVEIAEDDNVGDLSVEIDVSQLVADIEHFDAQEAEQKQAVRRRLEELNEAKEKELDSTYNINLDDD